MIRLFTLVVFLSQGSLFANDVEKAEVFVGSYRPIKKQCGWMGEYDRAYISIVTVNKQQKTKALRLNFYGDEARMDQVLLGSGSRQAPGTSVETHGRIVETWQTQWLSDTHLNSRTSTGRPGGQQATEEISLSIERDGSLFWTERDGGSRAHRNSCKLSPELSKAQKRSVCQAVVGNLEREDFDTETCLAQGTFKVEKNDASQWWIRYTAIGIWQDTTIVCELGMDKPIGRFAPALEFCGAE